MSKTQYHLSTVLIVLLLLAIGILGVWKFSHLGGKVFSCDKNGQSKVLAGSVIVFSCSSPRFIVSCDDRTLSFYNNQYHCSSFDGTKYRLMGKYDAAK